MKKHVISCYTFTKTYAMTGWRIGWAMAPPNVAKAMNGLQSQETSCPSSIASIDGAAK